MERLDIFGVPVTLNYRGSSKYKSKTGGILSLMFGFIVSYLIYIRVLLHLKFEPRIF
jgi:hypothetical protein